MIGKIEKARRYAQEPERVRITELTATFRGDNANYHVVLKDGQWSSDSPSFNEWHISPHIMAMQKILDPMLAEEARQLEEPTGLHLHSEIISKIDKARRYAQEPERVQISELKADFRGNNGEHQVSLSNGQWQCSSAFFRSWGTSPHIMAMQKLLEPMLSPAARQPVMAIDVPGEAVSL
jgi:hypothetical protein